MLVCVYAAANSSAPKSKLKISTPSVTCKKPSNSKSSATSISFAASKGHELPPGITLTAEGLLSGTPTPAGVGHTYTFQIFAEDAEGYLGSQNYNYGVGEPTVALSPASLPDAPTGVAYNQEFSATGGAAPYTYSVTAGSLPPGLILTAGGTLEGVPTEVGSYSFAVTSTDANGYMGSQTYELKVPLAAPSVTGLSPAAGLAAGGTAVTISGGNFVEVTGVNFGGVPASSFKVNSAGSITAVAPPGSARVDVSVSNPTGTSPTTAADQFEYVAPGPAPTVTKLSKTYGPVAGGSELTITGAGFTGVTGVSIAGVPTTWRVISSTAIAAKVPAHAPGKGYVVVTTPNGTNANASSAAYKFEPAVEELEPASAVAGAAAVVRVHGSGFATAPGATLVKFGTAKAAKVECPTSSLCIVTTPILGKGSVAVTVTVNKVTSAKVAADVFKFE